MGMIVLSLWLAKRQKTSDDYYVGGRNLSWWAVGISIVATQSSAISFVSIPAFVALREGGGLSWLQYELGVPLAMLFLLLVLIPHLRAKKLVSVYEFLRERFGLGHGAHAGGGLFGQSGLGHRSGDLCYRARVGSNVRVAGVGDYFADRSDSGGLRYHWGTQGGGGFGCYPDGPYFWRSDARDWFSAGGSGWLGGGMGCLGYGAKGGGRLEFGSGVYRRGAVLGLSWSVGVFLYSSYYGTDQSQVQRLLGNKVSEGGAEGGSVRWHFAVAA